MVGGSILRLGEVALRYMIMILEHLIGSLIIHILLLETKMIHRGLILVDITHISKSNAQMIYGIHVRLIGTIVANSSHMTSHKGDRVCHIKERVMKSSQSIG